jgi:hypothetical protein
MKKMDELFLKSLNNTLSEFVLMEKDRIFLESVKNHLLENGFASHKQKMTVVAIHIRYSKARNVRI